MAVELAERLDGFHRSHRLVAGTAPTPDDVRRALVGVETFLEPDRLRGVVPQYGTLDFFDRIRRATKNFLIECAASGGSWGKAISFFVRARSLGCRRRKGPMRMRKVRARTRLPQSTPRNVPPSEIRFALSRSMIFMAAKSIGLRPPRVTRSASDPSHPPASAVPRCERRVLRDALPSSSVVNFRANCSPSRVALSFDIERPQHSARLHALPSRV